MAFGIAYTTIKHSLLSCSLSLPSPHAEEFHSCFEVSVSLGLPNFTSLIPTMAKLNAPLRNKQRELRSKKAEVKRQAHGDAVTGKLKTVPPPTSLSGKRKRKFLKKWRQDQKAALEKGLLTMGDIQMMSVDDKDADLQKSTLDSSVKGGSMKLQIKKRAKLRVRKGKGKNRGNANAKGDSSGHGDAMVE